MPPSDNSGPTQWPLARPLVRLMISLIDVAFLADFPSGSVLRQAQNDEAAMKKMAFNLKFKRNEAVNDLALLLADVLSTRSHR